MPRTSAFSLTPLGLTAPDATRQTPLVVKFALARPSSTSSSSVLHPATGLQLCIRQAGHEVFLERMVAREVDVLDEGDDGGATTRCRIVVPDGDVPFFRNKAGEQQAEAAAEVALYAWQGERLLASYELGEIAARWY